MVKSGQLSPHKRIAGEHEVTLRGARFTGAGRAPAILHRTDQELVAVLLDKLASATGRTELAASVASRKSKNSVLKLFQPVHRIFHLALLEVYCRQPGEPRLDPARIESAGLVIRRLAGDGVSTEGWCEAQNTLRGWLKLDRREADQDPDPARRRARGAGHPEVDRRLAALTATAVPLAERSSPLFVAPPEVCKAAGRTLLYGFVPLASSELAEVSAEVPKLTEKELDEHLSPLLSGTRTRSSGDSGFGWLGRDLKSDDRSDPELRPLMELLEQLAVELDAFGDAAAARALVKLLDQVPLPYDRSTKGAGQVLKSAARVLFERATLAVRTPDRWPAIGQRLRRRIRDQVRVLFESRLAAVVPGQGRYAEADRRYRLRAFVRVRRRDSCPPDLVWSGSSAPFTIAPWYESGGAPPVQVALPDITDRNVLKNLKPDVTFAVPPKIHALLEGIGLDDLLKSKKGGGAGLGIGWRWLCSFNIPIITLCAFLVLSIFLSLFNFIFFWLPFVRICIPIPVPKKK